MRAVVVGLGVQGHKRRRFAGADFVCSVDVRNTEADFRDLRDVALDKYDAALLCVPDSAKLELLDYLVEQGKHALIEKPLVAEDDATLAQLEQKARQKNVVIYTAYNHRFEPHFVRMRDLVKSGALGTVYRCRMFYGNGTARLVRNSDWRDQGAGVLDDLGSHVLDTARFWFGDVGDEFTIVSADRFENRSPDHVVFAATDSRPRLEFEMTLLSWRNHFTCDVFAETGQRAYQFAVQMGAVRIHPSQAGAAERPAARAIGDARSGRSHLGARIRTFQSAVRGAAADRPVERHLAQSRVAQTRRRSDGAGP